MQENNPYQAPSSDLGTDDDSEFQLHEPRGVSAGRGANWLGEGFGYFKRSPLAWIVAIILSTVITTVLSMIPIIGMLSMILFYLFAGGFIIGTKAQHDGGSFEIGHLFSGFQVRANKLALCGLFCTIAFYSILAITLGSMFIQIMGLGNSDPSEHDIMSMLLKLLIALALMIPLAMATWFAPALIALHDVEVFEAFKMSFGGCLKNLIPFLIYGLLAFLLIIVALIPMGLGMLIVLPMFAASTFAAYKDIFVD